jgi:glycosyltransferase involved in cell wall biosynthesis
MSGLRIEICNERLLPRFGVDRFLILLGRKLAQEKHQITFVAMRADHSLLSSVPAEIDLLPAGAGLDMAATEFHVSQLLRDKWETRRPDAIVVGGWPFFSTAALAKDVHIASVFIDAGAVAQNDLSDSSSSIQRELRRIRCLTIPHITTVLPISDFIRDTQTEFDRGHHTGIRTVLLGADHMQLDGFKSTPSTNNEVLARLDGMIGQGRKLLIALGRYETGGYKNSRLVYDVLRLIQKEVKEVCVLLLDAGVDCEIPADLAPYFELLGTPDDCTLQQVMLRCSAGLSTSRWEGFNLPLAEMQSIRHPVVAFNIGAHPEVIAHPWLLCETPLEMASKLISILRGNIPFEFDQSFSRFQERFRWDTTLDSWKEEIECAILSARTAAPTVSPRLVLADVTNASQDTANPGVIRVVRRVCAELQRSANLELVFARWDPISKDYRFISDNASRRLLAAYSGPSDHIGMMVNLQSHLSLAEFLANVRIVRPQPPILFLPEVVLDGEAADRLNWATAHRFNSAAILYDLIPISHRELCDSAITAVFPSYLQALLGADHIWSISDATRSEFLHYFGTTDVKPVITTMLLPAQLAREPRRTADCRDLTQCEEARILCVSTLEPRKNHANLLRAFQLLRAENPHLRLRLILIGNRYAGAPEIVEQIKSAEKQDASIEWLGAVEDSVLREEFEKARFTVYPSLVEGFGLPILESLWMRRPCLVHQGGVMRELAEAGGCIVVDMNDRTAIKEALKQLATDDELIVRLSREATSRELLDWQQHSAILADALYLVKDKLCNQVVVNTTSSRS